MIGAPYAEIDLAALRANLGLACRMMPGAKVMAAVKANAYGHGLVEVAGALAADVDLLAVARVDEALALRQAGIVTPALIMGGVFNAEQLAAAQALGAAIVVHDPAQLPVLRRADPAHQLAVWLKVDTGMHRLGVSPASVRDVHAALAALPVVKAPVGLMTHLARADEAGDAFTAEQLECFARATQGLPGPRSIANSAAIMAWPEARAQWMRPGIMLYGANPMSRGAAGDHGLWPVMRFASELIAVRRVVRGERVGYGGDWQAPADTVVGTVAAGYGDGYPRHAPGGTPVLVGGRRVALVGRVSMDLLTVDLGPHATEQVGDPVTLWGDPALTVEEVAAWAGTIAYDLLCGVRGRVSRRFKPVEAASPARTQGRSSTG